MDPNIREKLTDAIIAGNIPQIVMFLLTLAFMMGSSDVHIEPGEKIVRIRFRVDGMLPPASPATIRARTELADRSALPPRISPAASSNRSAYVGVQQTTVAPTA